MVPPLRGKAPSICWFPHFTDPNALEHCCERRIMLHDILHEIAPEERFRYAQLLACLTQIDAAVTRAELSFFEQRLGASLLSPERRQQLRECLSEAQDLNKLLSEMQPKTIKLCLRDACLMTLADREIDDKERIVLEKVAKAAGLSSAHVDRLLGWVIQGYHWMQKGYTELEI